MITLKNENLKRLETDVHSIEQIANFVLKHLEGSCMYWESFDKYDVKVTAVRYNASDRQLAGTVSKLTMLVGTSTSFLDDTDQQLKEIRCQL